MADGPVRPAYTMIDQREEVGIVRVTAGNSDMQRILIHNISFFLSSRSTDSTAPPAVQPRVCFDGRGWTWTQSFMIRVDNEGSLLPFFLIHDRHTVPSSGSICVLLYRAKVDPGGDILNLIDDRLITQVDMELHRTGNQLCLIRDWTKIGKRDWMTTASKFMTRECFHLTSDDKDPNDMHHFLWSFVNHMFSHVCEGVGNCDSWTRKCISQDAYCVKEDEPVVQDAVTRYTQQMKQFLSDGEFDEKGSLVQQHTDLAAEAMDTITDMGSPFSMTINRIRLLDRLMRRQFLKVRWDHTRLQQSRKDFLIASLSFAYAKHLKSEMVQHKLLTAETLQQVHEAEMRKCLAQYRSQMSSGETELMMRMNQVFQLVQSVNAEARDALQTSLDYLVSDQESGAEEEMAIMLSQSGFNEVQIDHLPITSIHFTELESMNTDDESIMSMDMDPEEIGCVTSEFEAKTELKVKTLTSVDDEKQSLVHAGGQQQPGLMCERMHPADLMFLQSMDSETDGVPFMDWQDVDSLYRRRLDEYLNQWQDEDSRSELRDRLTKELDNLMQKLRDWRQEGDNRIKRLVLQELKVQTGNRSSDTDSIGELTEEHVHILQHVIDELAEDPEIQFICKTLRDMVAEADERIDKETDREEQVVMLVHRCCDSYVRSLGQACERNPSLTRSQLSALHHDLMQCQIDSLLSHQLIVSFPDQEKYEKHLRSLIEHEFEEKMPQRQRRPAAETPAVFGELIASAVGRVSEAFSSIFSFWKPAGSTHTTPAEDQLTVMSLAHNEKKIIPGDGDVKRDQHSCRRTVGSKKPAQGRLTGNHDEDQCKRKDQRGVRRGRKWSAGGQETIH